VGDAKYSVCFVCSGNICRSPMAEAVFKQRLSEAGLADVVEVSSAGIGAWHAGEPMDERAAETLADHGYPTEHVAAKVGARHRAADLVLAMDNGHRRELLRLVDDPAHLRMFRSFDPAADSDDLDVPDPYYGGNQGFVDLLAMIEATMPGLVTFVGKEVGRELAD
jgi:protein-tyrosine phosphatase